MDCLFAHFQLLFFLGKDTSNFDFFFFFGKTLPTFIYSYVWDLNFSQRNQKTLFCLQIQQHIYKP